MKMKKADLANRIRISEVELKTARISDFNKSTLMELIDSDFEGEVDDTAVEEAERLLKSFLNRTWREEPSAHKYVISACLALAFLFEKPMHPQDAVHYISKTYDGKERFYCRYNEKGTICDFCAADPMENPGE